MMHGIGEYPDQNEQDDQRADLFIAGDGAELLVLRIEEFLAAGERPVLTGGEFEHEADEDQAVDEHWPVIFEQLDEAKGESGIDRLH